MGSPGAQAQSQMNQKPATSGLTVAPQDQWIVDEYSALGLTPTQADINNWSKYGKPGQITTELGGGSQTVTLDNGAQVKQYNDLSAFGDSYKFDLSNKEGQIFSVPKGFPVASGKNYKYIKTENGFDYYVNKGSGGGGITGTLADLTGIQEFKTYPDKYIPNELKIMPIPGIGDPSGITTEAIFGKGYRNDAASSVANPLGLNTSDVTKAQDLGAIGAEIALASMGAPYAAAELQSAKSGSQFSGGEKSAVQAATEAGIAFAAAGITNYLTTPANSPDSSFLNQTPPGQTPIATSTPELYGSKMADPSIIPISGDGTTAPVGFDPNANLIGQPSVDYAGAAASTPGNKAAHLASGDVFYPTTQTAKTASGGVITVSGWTDPKTAAAFETISKSSATTSIFKEPWFWGLSSLGAGLGAMVYSGVQGSNLYEDQKKTAEEIRQEQYAHDQEMANLALTNELTILREKNKLDMQARHAAQAPSSNYSGGIHG